jgi:hypothetical protein
MLSNVGLGPTWFKIGRILNPVIFGLPQFPNLGIASLSKMRKKGPKRPGIKALGASRRGMNLDWEVQLDATICAKDAK